ncbi:SgcJ/EcaC family oxidoreductase [Limibacter armeniacum]|uniref:YybH family protein n=1 Tax=Limibacter armeniacum TaxID=466084 RepID=UPI002FE63AB8
MKSLLDDKTTNEIQTILGRFLDTWNDKDLEGFMDNFLEDAEFTDVVSQTAIGKEAIKKQHDFAFNVVMKNASFEMKNLLIREILSDVVMVSANWLNKNSQTPNGKHLPDRNGVIQFVIMKDQDLNWKFKIVHNSDFSLPYEKQERIIE